MARIHPNMSEMQAVKVARALGVRVTKKHRHGEIVFEHKKRAGNYTMHAGRESVGKGWVDWMKPIIQEANQMPEQIMNLMPDTLRFYVAEAVKERSSRGETSTPENTYEYLAAKHPRLVRNRLHSDRRQWRKQLNDALCHLFRDGFMERPSPANYLAGDLLYETFRIIEGQQDIELFKRTRRRVKVDPETYEATIVPPGQDEQPEPEKPESSEKIDENVDIQALHDQLLSNLTVMQAKMVETIERLQAVEERLVKIVERFEHAEDVREAVEILEDLYNRKQLKSR